MASSPATFRQADLKRALKAAADVGLQVTAFKIDPLSGRIEVVTGKAVEQDSTALDDWRASRGPR
jgi:hypothetical protein